MNVAPAPLSVADCPRLKVGEPAAMHVNRALLMRLLCVALVAAVMVPLGNAVFPYVSGALDGTQFQAIEAVLSATLGFGIHALIG